MRRRMGMETVELVERDDVPPRPDAPDDVDPRRRSRRWLLVPVLVVAVALVGVQVVVEARERAAVEALAQVEGVVRPVDEDVRILWTLERRHPVGALVGADRWRPRRPAAGQRRVAGAHRGRRADRRAPLDHPPGRRARRTMRRRGSARSVAVPLSRRTADGSCAW